MHLNEARVRVGEFNKELLGSIAVERRRCAPTGKLDVAFKGCTCHQLPGRVRGLLEGYGDRLQANKLRVVTLCTDTER